MGGTKSQKAKWVKLTDQVLGAGWEALVLGQVVEEVLDVTRVGVDGGGGDEAVGLLGAVGTVPESPVAAIDVGGGDLFANGLSRAVLGEPKEIGENEC